MGRVLVVVGADIYVRNTITSGSFDSLDGVDVYYVSSDRLVRDPEPLALREGYLGAVADPVERAKAYGRLELLMRVARRRRSETLKLKTRLLSLPKRLLLQVIALPGLRRVATTWLLLRAGRNRELERLIADLRPDVVIAPSGGGDPIVLDAVRATKRLGITSVVLVHNWDGITSKGALPIAPDLLAVWGDQSAEHARTVLGLPPSRIRVLGAPSLDHYFHRAPQSTESPFPFRYVLFAGCYAPFDERAAIEALDSVIERTGLDLKLVYRPHPFRARRRMLDHIDESSLSNVVVDPAVRDSYLMSRAEYETGSRTPVHFPPLETYPALLEHAEFVVCPLSTMMLEAAVMGSGVLALAYDDGVHRESPSFTVGFDHFEGLDQLTGIEFVRHREDLPQAFVRDAKATGANRVAGREDLKRWIYFDEHTYAERVRDLIAGVVAPRGGDRQDEQPNR